MPTALSGRDLLSIADLKAEEIRAVLDLALAAKAGRSLGQPLAGRHLALIFQRPSNRTRVSFEVAVRRLGGHPIPLFSQEIQIGERESVADVSRILDRYVDGIVARLISHRDLVRMAEWADGPGIHAVTHLVHPGQALADCLTVRESAGAIGGARGAYIRGPTTVCPSWVHFAV